MHDIFVEINFQPVPLWKRIYLASKIAKLAWHQLVGRHAIYVIHECGESLTNTARNALAKNTGADAREEVAREEVARLRARKVMLPIQEPVDGDWQMGFNAAVEACAERFRAAGYEVEGDK